MEAVPFDQAETYEPEAGWRRVAMAGSEAFSFEWFEKPPGHSSPMHDHENEQVCLVLQGELTVYTEGDSEGEREANDGTEEAGAGDEVTLGPYDSVWLAPWEPHRVENTGTERAVGIDVFAPGRSFDFWLDRE